MRAVRVWTDNDGESQATDVELDYEVAGVAGVDRALVRAATQVRIRRFDPGFVTTWHPARSAATMAVWTDGAVEVEVSDGTMVSLAEGDARCILFEDRPGRGHRFRVHKHGGVTFALVSLAD